MEKSSETNGCQSQQHIQRSQQISPLLLWGLVQLVQDLELEPYIADKMRLGLFSSSKQYFLVGLELEVDDRLALEQDVGAQALEESQSHGYAQYNPSMVVKEEPTAELLRMRRCMSSNNGIDVGLVVVEDHRVEVEDESFFFSSF